MPKGTTLPSLSVVVVIFTGRPNLVRCLESLAGQRGGEDVEVIVPCDARTLDVASLKGQFPFAHFLQLEGERTYAELRAIGVRHARGRIVAITEDHCIPEPDWCAQILKEHRRPPAAVGGAVEKKAPDTALNWSLYLMDYLRYMKPVAEGPVDQLTDCNVTYKRRALEAIADVWTSEFHEPAVHWALQSRGEALWFSPHVAVSEQRSLGVGSAVRDRYAFGRLFASTRAAEVSALKRLFYVAFSPLLPALLITRVAAGVVRKRRCGKEFVRSLPFLTLLTSAWAWGEFLGSLTGRAESSLSPRPEGAAAASPSSQGATL